MRDRNVRTAERFGLMPLCRKLEQDLMAIEYVTDVDFDLDGFYDNLNQVIVLAGYELPSDNYFPLRRELVRDIIARAYANDLVLTADAIEDYGAHYYFVFSCGSDWRNTAQKKGER